MNDNPTATAAKKLPEIDWGPWGTPGPLRAQNLNIEGCDLTVRTENLNAMNFVATNVLVQPPKNAIQALLEADGQKLMVSVFLAAFAATGGVVGCLFILFGIRKLIVGE